MSLRLTRPDEKWGGSPLGAKIRAAGPSVITQNRPTKTALRTLTLTEGIPFVNVSHVLSEQKKQQVIALGRLRWTPGRRGALWAGPGSSVKPVSAERLRPPGSWGRRPPAEPANGVITDSDPAKPVNGVTAGLTDSSAGIVTAA